MPPGILHELQLTNDLPKPGFEHQVKVSRRRLIVSKDGVLSSVYVLVAAALIGAAAVFGTCAGTSPIKDTLTSAKNTIVLDEHDCFKGLDGGRRLMGLLPPAHWCLRPAFEA